MVPRLQTWMSMRWLAIWCVSMGAAACADPAGETGDVTPDGPPSERTGLTLEFIADTEIPAQLGPTVRVDDIYLNGSMIRAIGDATTQDEQPTTRRDHALHWDTGEAPPGLTFSAAPTGEYSYVELRIANRPGAPRYEAFEIRGRVRDDDGDGGDGDGDGDRWTDFRIRAVTPIVIAQVPASMRLEAGRPLTIRLELAVRQLLQGIDWASLPRRDGALQLGEETPAALASFCGQLGDAFRAR
jgi:hypothetical protein